MAMLIDLAKECEVEQWCEKMFSGERINSTEDRAILHTALRSRSDKLVMLDGKNVKEDVQRS